VAEAHGGSISAGASPEGGARVQIELPGFRPEQSRSSNDVQPAPA
jgi:signal transduction histidine kinase